MRKLILLVLSASVSLPGADVAALIANGMTSMYRGNAHAAEIAFRQAVEADANSAEAHAKLSYAIALQMHQGPVTSPDNGPLITLVLEEQQKAVNLAPGNAWLVRRLAFIQDAIARVTNRPDEHLQMGSLALQNLKRAIELAPKDPEGYFQLAAMEVFNANTGIWFARQTAKDNMSNSRIGDAALRESLFLQHRAALDDAIAACEKVIALQPTNGFAMLLAAAAHGLRAALADSDLDATSDLQAAKEWRARFQKQWGASYSTAAETTALKGLLNPQLVVASTAAAYGGPLGLTNGRLGEIPSAPALPPAPFPGLGNGRGSLSDPNRQVYRIGGNVSAPLLLKKVEPMYSDEARKTCVQGTVLLSMVVDQEGMPRDLHIIRPLGHGLDEKAIEAVNGWRFTPGMKDGHAVATMAQVEVNFRLLYDPLHPCVPVP